MKYIIKLIMILAAIMAFLSSCVNTEEIVSGYPIIVKRVTEENSGRSTRGIAINEQSDLKEKQFGISCFYFPSSSGTYKYFDVAAVVNDDYSATLSSVQHWPIRGAGDIKLFSWYPYSGTYKPTTDFSTAGQMKLIYSADEHAANHVDVLAAVSKPAWKEDVNIHFYHTLTKVTFTFQKEEAVSETLTVTKIEFKDIGKEGELIVNEIPTSITTNGKPKFTWENITEGNIASNPTTGNTVTTAASLIGDTFLMLPAESFSESAKIVITTDDGITKDEVWEFPLKGHLWEPGEYINYNIKLSNASAEIKSTLLEWKENPVDVIFDRDYYLKVSESVTLVAGIGATVEVTVQTNYNADPDTGYPPGAYLASVDNPATVNNNLNLGWAIVNRGDHSLSNGVYTYKVKIAINSFSETGEREAYYYINAGNLRHKMTIKQLSGSEPWLIGDVQADVTSPDRYKIVITSKNQDFKWDWQVSEVSDPDDILLNKQTILGATGSDGDTIYFYYKKNASSGQRASLKIVNTNGSNLPVQVEILK